MATKYRIVVNVDDHLKRGMMLPFRTLEAPRDSKKLRESAMQALREMLAQSLPIGSNANAYVELSGRYGTETIARAKGIVIATRKGKDGYCMVSDKGRWDVTNAKNEAMFSVLV